MPMGGRCIIEGQSGIGLWEASMNGDLLTVECDNQHAGAIKESLDAASGENALLQRVQGSGGVTVYQVIVDVALPVALALLPTLLEIVRKHRPKSIRFGEFEIENPSEEQAAQMWEDYLATRRGD